MPTVSVIIPTYNRCESVQEAIESILAQTYKDYEIIVIDDGSTDGTEAVLRARYGKRIRYEWQPNGGTASARDHGIALSRAPFLQFLDSDDAVLPRKLEIQTGLYEQHPDADIIYCDSRYFGEFWCDLYSPTWCRDVSGSPLQGLIAGSAFPVHAALVRASAVQAVGCFCLGLASAEDWDLWLRLALFGSQFLYHPDMLALYRLTPGAKTTMAIEWRQAHVEVMQRVREAIHDDSLLGHLGWPGNMAVNRWHYALALYADGSWDDGRAQLAHPEMRNAAWLRSEDTRARELAEHALAFEASKDADPGSGATMIRDACAIIEKTHDEHKALLRMAECLYWQARAFSAHERGARSQVLLCAARAALRAPMALTNLGLMSVSAQAVLGCKLW